MVSQQSMMFCMYTHMNAYAEMLSVTRKPSLILDVYDKSLQWYILDYRKCCVWCILTLGKYCSFCFGIPTLTAIVSFLHYNDVIMGAIASKITSLTTQQFFHAQIKVDIKDPRHWPLCGEFTGNRRIPRTKKPVTRKMFPFDDVIMLYTFV